MYTYEFFDEATGEAFFVESTDKREAIATARIFFEEPHCYGKVSEEYAEMMGYDTYQKGD